VISIVVLWSSISCMLPHSQSYLIIQMPNGKGRNKKKG
jgi:hypothetical protein